MVSVSSFATRSLRKSCRQEIHTGETDEVFQNSGLLVTYPVQGPNVGGKGRRREIVTDVDLAISFPPYRQKALLTAFWGTAVTRIAKIVTHA